MKYSLYTLKAHNQIKRDLYDELINYWKKAVDIASSKLNQGKIFGQQVVTDWAKQYVSTNTSTFTLYSCCLNYRLLQHDAETNGRFTEVIQLFKERFGWIIGIDGNTPLSAITSRNNIW